LVSELRLTAGCVLMELASPAVSETSVYANGLMSLPVSETGQIFVNGDCECGRKHSGSDLR